VVDVLGEADLVDPTLGSLVHEALGGFDVVVDRLVGRAKVHVVVDDHSHEAISSRSAGVVTFNRRGSPSTARTRPPLASTREAQSVNVVSVSCRVEKASRRTGATNAWGVWDATRPSRSSVSATASPSTRLNVSLIRRTGTAPSQPSESAVT